jgi:hypothetical protein
MNPKAKNTLHKVDLFVSTLPGRSNTRQLVWISWSALINATGADGNLTRGDFGCEEMLCSPVLPMLETILESE